MKTELILKVDLVTLKFVTPEVVLWYPKYPQNKMIALLEYIVTSVHSIVQMNGLPFLNIAISLSG